jgi:hypothetical protein
MRRWRTCGTRHSPPEPHSKFEITQRAGAQLISPWAGICTRAAARPIHWLAIPTPYPMADTEIRSENDPSDWRVGKRTESQGRYSGAKPDLRYHSREAVSREVRMHTHKSRTWIPLASCLESRTSDMTHLEIREHTIDRSIDPELGRLRKQGSAQVCGVLVPRNVYDFFYAFPLNDERQGWRPLGPPSALHRENVTDFGPQGSHHIAFKLMRDLCAFLTTRP